MNRSPGRQLRDAWMLSSPLLIPGVFSPLLGKIAEKLGFAAVYLSGGALSASLGIPDIGLITASEFAEEIRRITQATRLPLLADADTGFGEVLSVERTVRLYEAAGAAGLHLEDQVLPKRCGHLSGKSLISTAAMVAKIRAAVSARTNPDFVIMARTDARGVVGFEDAVTRAHEYHNAGADAIFPEALESAEEFQRFAREVPAPLLANMTEFGKSPILDAPTLADYGYRMILYPLTAFRSAYQAAITTLRSLHELQSQKSQISSMMSRADLYDYLQYQDYEQRDRAYFTLGAE
jgi:methylisocitrate lyase